MRVLQAWKIEKTFAEGREPVRVLRGVSLEVDRGEIVTLEGPSGSGKTTLLSILGCVLSPTAGEVHLCDEEVSRLRESDLPRIRTSYIGFIFQGHNLIASLTAQENVALQLELRGVDTAKASREARDLLVKVGIGDKCDRK